MKKKIISIVGASLFVGALWFNIEMNLSNNHASDVTLKNIEALTASAEETGPGDCCLNGFQTWGGAFWRKDAKDCWCTVRENVVDPCDC